MGQRPTACHSEEPQTTKNLVNSMANSTSRFFAPPARPPAGRGQAAGGLRMTTGMTIVSGAVVVRFFLRGQMRKNPTPLLWTLFSAGGTLAALLFPVHLFLTGLAFPLGWLEPPGYDSLLRLVAHPLARLYLFLLISLPLFHWAHRFRYTLYDGLSLKHLTGPIVVFAYGGALLASILAAYTLWNIP